MGYTYHLSTVAGSGATLKAPTDHWTLPIIASAGCPYLVCRGWAARVLSCSRYLPGPCAWLPCGWADGVPRTQRFHRNSSGDLGRGTRSPTSACPALVEHICYVPSVSLVWFPASWPPWDLQSPQSPASELLCPWVIDRKSTRL